MTFPLLLSRYSFLGGSRGSVSYWQQVLNTATANLIGYWRMNEASGTNADDSSSENNDGTYKGSGEPLLANAAGPDTVLVPLFDGTNDYMSFYTAGFASDFNANEGTMVCWGKVSAAGVWTDGTERALISIMDGSANLIIINRNSANNYLTFQYKSSFEDLAGQSSTDWMHLAITWSQAANEVKFYKNGIQVGTTKTFPGAIGSLFSSGASVGVKRSDSMLSPWSGWAAHAAIWNTPLTPSQISILANP